MGRIVIYPYKFYSKSAKDLLNSVRQHYGGRSLRVRPDGTFVPRPDDTIINWGSAKVPRWDTSRILNKPENIANAVNKIKTFELLDAAGVRSVPHTTDPDIACTWERIVERHRVTGRSGAGIRLSTPETIMPARLYTQFLEPTEEYRVHVFRGEVVDYSKKFKRTPEGIVFVSSECPKNRATGWEYMRDVTGMREGVVLRAKAAVEALGLDFGVVDIIRHNNKSYVLEVNTACGLSSRGLQAYTNKLISLAQNNG